MALYDTVSEKFSGIRMNTTQELDKLPADKLIPDHILRFVPCGNVRNSRGFHSIKSLKIPDATSDVAC
jgi:hypothetical protein